MRRSTHAEYVERCLFQGVLDNAFPHGALCVVLESVDGRLAVTGAHGPTGRLFCCDARKQRLAGRWEYEILIDFRRSSSPADAPPPIRLWIRDINRIPAVVGLWEADVVGDGSRLLRINAEPPKHLRPGRRARTAVTNTYEAELFPEGLTGSRAEPAPSI